MFNNYYPDIIQSRQNKILTFAILSITNLYLESLTNYWMGKTGSVEKPFQWTLSFYSNFLTLKFIG